jgi:transglutaminase-like putative cysteine protease
VTGVISPPRRHGAGWPAPGPPGSGDRRTPTAGAGGPDGVDQARPAATAALVVLTLASAAGLFRVFSADRWLGPVLVTILAVHLVCWVLRRLSVPQWAAVPVVVVAIGLLVAWTLFGRYTTGGVPTGRTWHQAALAFGAISSQFASTQPPVAPSPSFELLAVLGAGGAAALADWAAFRWRSPLVAVMPGLAVFIFCCAAGVGRGRGAVIAALIAALCLFLLVERTTGGSQVWFAGTHARVGAWAAGVGGIVTVAAVFAGLALSPALAGRDGSAVLGWRSGFGQGGGTRIVQNPLVDLRTQLINFPNVPVFEVSSSTPSYWRLTALDQFDGVLWQSSGSYEGFGSRLPGAPPVGQAVQTVRATFQIQELDSNWLPAQFNPVAVQGVRGVTYDRSSESLLTPTQTTPDLQYSVTSYELLSTLSAAELNAAPPLRPDSTVETNLELPPINPRITALAQSLTAGASTEYQKALAIQNYLRGPDFRYSLNPPSDGSGTQAITNFLFSTRTGYCQQFAGAYAVLARAAGLPTRLAIGFAQGDEVGSDTYQVHDRDAHTWPEVYFGPKFGWVPFEPTKGFAIPDTGSYNFEAGGGAGAGGGPTTTVPPTTIPTAQTAPGTAGHTVTPKTLPAGNNTTAGSHRGGPLSPWLLAIPLAILAWPFLNTGIPWLLRHRRRRVAAKAGSRSATLNAWDEVTSKLVWTGVTRRPEETDDEFAARASAILRRQGLQEGWSAGGIEGLAGMAQRAAFASEVPDDLGPRASEAADEIEKRLASLSGPGQRLARLWTLPPGTWDRLIDALHPDTGRPGKVRRASG